MMGRLMSMNGEWYDWFLDKCLGKKEKMLLRKTSRNQFVERLTF